MGPRSDANTESADRATAFVDSILGIVFLGLAAWFITNPALPELPLAEGVEVSKAQIAPGARRAALQDPPATVVGGYSHNCNDCHRLFDSPPTPGRALLQHVGIQLNHGLNNRCFNCHDERNRERLVLFDGTTLSYEETPRLCAQCHGTVYRDWTRGTHGKTMGSWDASSGRQRRLHCNECHDPHAPAYQPIAPLPGPNTLRMGDQEQHDEGPHRHEPLSRTPSRPAAPHQSTPIEHEELPR